MKKQILIEEINIELEYLDISVRSINQLYQIIDEKRARHIPKSCNEPIYIRVLQWCRKLAEANK